MPISRILLGRETLLDSVLTTSSNNEGQLTVEVLAVNGPAT